MKPSGRIAYVLNAFPVVSETFILNEMRAMESGGVPIVILPLTQRQDRVRHGSLGALGAPVIRPPGDVGWGLLRRLRTAAAEIARHPLSAFRLARADLFAPLVRLLGRRGVENRKILAKRLRLLGLAGWIAGEARRAGAVHLHAHYAREPLEVADRVQRLTGLPYSFAAHAKDLYTPPAKRLARRIRTSRFAVACHGDGEATMRGLAGGSHADRVLRIPHGFDTSTFRPGPRRREPGLILAVGRLTPKKGYDHLVAACARLRARRLRFRCVILGEGKEEGRLQAAIDAANLRECVSLHPFVPQEQLPSWYARASLFAMPSRVLNDGNRDGIPNALVEAMACGVPVVGTDAGGIAEVVTDGETGRVVAPDDPDSLADAMVALLEDPSEAERLGRAAAKAVGDMDFRRMVRPLLQRFQRILGGNAVTGSVRWRSGAARME
jgi:glycosyltransferase involved in cell wall biosynthesis